MSRHLVITEEAAGERLDVTLAKLTGLSRSQVQKRLADGTILMDGQLATSKDLSRAGSKVTLIDAPVEALSAVPNLAILYEDEDMLAIDKPAGLAVHLSESGREQPTVAAFAAAHGVHDDDPERQGIVHRLDKDTSGVLVLAKHPQAKAYLQQQFKERRVDKTYLALVRGRMDEPQATINLPIDRSRKQPTKRAVVPGGRPAVTHYRVLQELNGVSLLEVKLETGRTHQIRVHFAHLGHPVVGDELYGGPKLPNLNRQFLHASRLQLVAPNGKTVAIESPLPQDLETVLTNLKSGIL
jgi:23S rRNA pseudouridine1911/1915/1917 synthase